MARKTTPTHVLLNQIELSSSASSVTFSAIPQGYGDLILVFDGLGTANSYLFSYPNGDTGNASQVVMQGDGSSAVSSAFSGLSWGTINTSTRTTAVLQWMDYSATDKHKTILIRDNESDTLTIARAVRWASTAAVTSIEITPNSGNIGAGSTFSLYGVYA